MEVEEPPESHVLQQSCSEGLDLPDQVDSAGTLYMSPPHCVCLSFLAFFLPTLRLSIFLIPSSLLPLKHTFIAIIRNLADTQLEVVAKGQGKNASTETLG